MKQKDQKKGKEKNKNRNYLYWAPRILGIVYILFTSVFAFSVFQEDYAFTQNLLAFFVFLVPSAVLLICLLIAWKYEFAGAVIFIFFGIYDLLTMRSFPVSVYLTVTGPILIIGLLFMLNWMVKKRIIVFY